MRCSAAVWWVRCLYGTLDDDEVRAERYRPAGIIKRDRPCPAAVPTDVGYPVEASAVVDDVASLEVKRADRGGRHRASSRKGHQGPERRQTFVQTYRTPDEADWFSVANDEARRVGDRHRGGSSPIPSEKGRSPSM